jgi:putative CRISPR-associated protein (TIGR02619 family)
MATHPASTLICTVGTSLFNTNLSGLKAEDPDPRMAALATAYAARDPAAIARGLAALDPGERLCGAEINSNALLIGKGPVADRPKLFLVHSDSEEGRRIGQTLASYYGRQPGLDPVQTCQIADLQDRDPRRFRVFGLRNLARTLCRIVRDFSPAACAINATGGYKAQIAIAVLLGQALAVPVYYKHERFDEIIALPPMPVALDFEVWLRLGGVLYELDREGQVAASEIELPHGSAEVFESLVEREPIDGVDYVALSPTGQIFHETFRQRFGQAREHVLPPPAPPERKKEPHIEDGHTREVRGLQPFLVALTREVPQVVRCETWYSNPALPRPSKFWINPEGLVGQFGDGRGLAKFRVETTATTDSERAAVHVVLNEWLDARR